MSVDLAPLRDLLHQLNNPQKQFRTIHIAGNLAFVAIKMGRRSRSCRTKARLFVEQDTSSRPAKIANKWKRVGSAKTSVRSYFSLLLK
jgi:hypothetical protein